MQRVSNHPVHLIDEDGKLSPSAFIPFCDFGGNMSAFGINIKNTSEIHFCKIFEAKIMQNQLCYEVDLDKHKNKANFDKFLKLGLVFLMDYNEDRQVALEDNKIELNNDSLVDRVDNSHEEENAYIYLNTIGDF